MCHNQKKSEIPGVKQLYYKEGLKKVIKWRSQNRKKLSKRVVQKFEKDKNQTKNQQLVLKKRMETNIRRKIQKIPK